MCLRYSGRRTGRVVQPPAAGAASGVGGVAVCPDVTGTGAGCALPSVEVDRSAIIGGVEAMADDGGGLVQAASGVAGKVGHTTGFVTHVSSHQVEMWASEDGLATKWKSLSNTCRKTRWTLYGYRSIGA